MERHIFICGAKGFGSYGGYETFINKLTEYHQEEPGLHYYVTCKANGSGAVNEAFLPGAVSFPAQGREMCFQYHNAICFKIPVPELGSAQAVAYDFLALNHCLHYCEEHRIDHPIFYILACRLGPLIWPIRRRISHCQGMLFVNPDGHEWMRQKWSLPVRRYWKMSENHMVLAADLVVCDSQAIESYIHSQYQKASTVFIPYGAELVNSPLADDDPLFLGWLAQHDLKINAYYLMVCRFVPENSYRDILSAFMKSTSRRSLVIISTDNPAFYRKLDSELHFSSDKRIRFVGSVYDQVLLKKIRENAWAYIHGHTVGGTNPSLLEALSSTPLNLVRDVPFNREVALDSSIYWTPDTLNARIHQVDHMGERERKDWQRKARARIRDSYQWSHIAAEYKALWSSAVDDSSETIRK